MTVRELLQASRDAHQQYRDNLPRRVPSGDSTVAVPGNLELAGAFLVEACRTRVDAQALDPDHLDPAWADQPATFPHDALMTFYATQLSR